MSGELHGFTPHHLPDRCTCELDVVEDTCDECGERHCSCPCDDCNVGCAAEARGPSGQATLPAILTAVLLAVALFLIASHGSTAVADALLARGW